MMGGDDLVLEGAPRGDELDLTVRWLRWQWCHAVVDVPGQEPLPISSEVLFPLTAATEAFIYRDRASFESWQQEGLTDWNADAVIWVALNEDCVSFVMNHRDSVSGRLVRGIIENLRQNRWQAHNIDERRVAA